MKPILFLTIKKEYFDAILSGEKTEEYRAISPFYKSRLENKNYTHIILQNGYNKNSRRLKAEFLGYEIKKVATKLYGNTEVFAIKLKNPTLITQET